MINVTDGNSGTGASRTQESKKTWGVGGVVFILAVFLLCRIPIATEYYNYHSDEAFYTDNAIEMLHRGDYITPFHTDGTPRFDKPPITCWLVVLGFKLFGISILSSRVLFLAIGALIVWMTYRLARTLIDDDASAVLAPLIMASNATFMYHSGYALTDGLLTLAVLTAHIGCIRILLLGQRTAVSLACAYVGTGTAVFVKGLPGLLPLRLRLALRYGSFPGANENASAFFRVNCLALRGCWRDFLSPPPGFLPKRTCAETNSGAAFFTIRRRAASIARRC